MCFDPVTGSLLAAALMGGGAAASYVGDQQAGKAQMSRYAAEKSRQDELSAQQDALLQDSLNRVAMVPGQGQQTAVDDRKAAYVRALNERPAGQDYLPGSGSANAVVGENAAKVADAEHARADQSADALARLNGLGDSLFTTGIATGRNMQRIGQTGTAKAGSAAVLPAELEAASYKGSGLRSLGSLAQTIGGMALGNYLPGSGLFSTVAKAKVPTTFWDAARNGIGAVGGPVV